MNNSNLDFKVFVSDEVFDFRTLEDKHSKMSFSPLPVRTRSYNTIELKHKRDLSLHDERHLQTNEKPKSSFNVTPPQRLRKPKLKNRSKTVDPRFRRSRSPNANQISISQSTNILNKSLINQGKNITSFSASSPAIQVNNVHEETFKDFKNLDKTKPNPCNLEPCIMNESERRFIEGNENVTLKHNSTDDDSPFYCSLDFCENLNTQRGDLDNDTLYTEDQSTNQIPYWDDPRMSIHKRSAYTILPVKSHAVVPLMSKRSQNSSFTLCRKCETDMDKHSVTTYKYDDVTEVCSCSLLSDEVDVDSRYFKDATEKTFVIPHIILGSAFGIIIFSCMVWLANLYLSWSVTKIWQIHTPTYYMKQNENYIIYCVKCATAYFLYGLDVLYDKMYNLFMIQRSDIFNNANTRDEISWW